MPSLEMPLINGKVELSLTWIENYVLCSGENIDSAGAVVNVGTAATFKITDAKIYVPVVTLSTENNVKLSKVLSEGFKRPIYWNKYEVIRNNNQIGTSDNPRQIRELLDSSYQGIKILFFLLVITLTIAELPLILTKNVFFQE